MGRKKPMAARLKDAVVSLKLANAELQEKLDALAAELAAASEYKAATSDALKIISGSSFDLQFVLFKLAETAARLCRTDYGAILRREGEVYRMAATVTVSLAPDG